jgi:hypothetical protein
LQEKKAMSKTTISAEDYAKINDLIRIGNRAVRRAQEENRQKGVPNVYSFDGILYYELPNGELSRTDPYQKIEQELIEKAP